MVLNEDSLVVTDTFADPYSFINVAHTTHTNIRPLSTGGYGMWLDVYHVYEVNPSVTPHIMVFGRTPQKVPAGDRLHPFDTDSGWDDVTTDGFWVPLGGNNGVTAAYGADLAFVDANAMNAATLGRNMLISPPLRYHLAGCNQVMVSISVAATVTTTSLIVGRLVG